MNFFEKLIRFTSLHRIWAHLVFWCCTFLVMTSRNYSHKHDYQLWQNLLENGVYLVFSATAAYFLSYFILPRLFRGHRYYVTVLYFLAGSYVITACSRIVVVHVLEPIVLPPPIEQESIREILTDLLKLFLGYFFSIFSPALVFVFLKLLKDQYLVQQHALSLGKEKAESELRALKAQLNPHFLFNTLNNIYSLSLVNSPKTSPSIAGLSAILDHVLYRCNGAYVPLSAEIALLRHYITLERLRYDERLKVIFEADTDAEAEIAPLILLSLVENAFKHGAGEDIGQPHIDIRLQLVNKRFYFKVLNAYVPHAEETDRNKIGLDNIRKQLELVHPLRHRFSVWQEGSIFVAELTIEL